MRNLAALVKIVTEKQAITETASNPTVQVATPATTSSRL